MLSDWFINTATYCIYITITRYQNSNQCMMKRCVEVLIRAARAFDASTARYSLSSIFEARLPLFHLTFVGELLQQLLTLFGLLCFLSATSFGRLGFQLRCCFARRLFEASSADSPLSLLSVAMLLLYQNLMDILRIMSSQMRCAFLRKLS